MVESVEDLDAHAEPRAGVARVQRQGNGLQEGDVGVGVARAKDLVSVLLAEIGCGGEVSRHRARNTLGHSMTRALGRNVRRRLLRIKRPAVVCEIAPA